jgi:HPr kinase/phosphorylase
LPDAAAEVVHGTCVALGQRGALLRGPSGCGKSDLALRFLFLPRRGPLARDAPALVADDQVELVRAAGSRVLAAPLASIRGKLEVRGVGIVGVKTLARCELAVVVDLVRPSAVERMPTFDLKARLVGVELPLLRLTPFESSAPIKLALAVAHASRS